MDLARSIIAPETEHTHTVIFLHGRGSTAQDLAEGLFMLKSSSGRSLCESFPSVRWVFPQAELLYCEENGQDWSQWFDVWNILDYTDREELQAPGLQSSVKSIIKLVHQEAQKIGGLHKVVLAGFSQGGSTAIYVLLHMPPLETSSEPPRKRLRSDSVEGKPAQQHLAGLMGFSCRLPFPGGTLEETREVLGLDVEPNDEILRNTPVFLAHCVDDPLVFVEYGRQCADALAAFNMRGVTREYPEGGHTINAPQGIDDIAIFLQAQGIKAAPP